MLTANYLQNRGPVVGRSLTPYEGNTGHKPILGHLRRIGQIGLSQSRNLIQAGEIGKIEQNVGYEGHHTYRMVDSEGKIKWYSRVAWINDGTSQTRDKDHSPPLPPKR